MQILMIYNLIEDMIFNLINDFIYDTNLIEELLITYIYKICINFKENS
jgi:hypothetical protein